MGHVRTQKDAGKNSPEIRIHRSSTFRKVSTLIIESVAVIPAVPRRLANAVPSTPQSSYMSPDFVQHCIAWIDTRCHTPHMSHIMLPNTGCITLFLPMLRPTRCHSIVDVPQSSSRAIRSNRSSIGSDVPPYRRSPPFRVEHNNASVAGIVADESDGRGTFGRLAERRRWRHRQQQRQRQRRGQMEEPEAEAAGQLPGCFWEG